MAFEHATLGLGAGPGRHRSGYEEVCRLSDLEITRPSLLPGLDQGAHRHHISRAMPTPW